MILESIRSLVKNDLLATDRFICNELQSDVPFINQLVEYILSCGGKRIRPLLALLSAHAFSHKQNLHIDLAAAIELIHTATLLHDDVVDHSELRRGNKTANTLWGNEASVLVGDFLYSRAFQLIVRLRNLTILDIFSSATSIIAEGEVLQLINCHDPKTTESAYFDVIKRKTAKLFEVATETGAALSTDLESHLEVMRHFGLQLGIAYQLIDDALDFNSNPEQTGKIIGNDLSEGKPTLPLIYALQQGKDSETRLLRDAIQNGNTKDLTSVLEIIESTGAIEYTANTAKQHAHVAIKALQHIPETPYRDAMISLAEFVVERNY